MVEGSPIVSPSTQSSTNPSITATQSWQPTIAPTIASLYVYSDDGDGDDSGDNGYSVDDVDTYDDNGEILTISYQPTTAVHCSSINSIGCCALCASKPCSITLTSNVSSIAENAFRSCTSLISVTIPFSVTTIGSSAFEGCLSLTLLSIPNSVISIGNAVCRGCTSLTSASWSNKVSIISSYAFSGCSSLIGISIPDTVTAISDSALNGCPILCLAWNKAITRTIGNNNGVVSGSTAICCTNGQFITQGNSFSCSLCPSGTFAIGPVTTCSPCPTGYTSAPGSASCHPCPLGSASVPGSPTCSNW